MILVFLLCPKDSLVMRKTSQGRYPSLPGEMFVISFTNNIPFVICMGLQIKTINLIRVAKDALQSVF